MAIKVTDYVVKIGQPNSYRATYWVNFYKHVCANIDWIEAMRVPHSRNSQGTVDLAIRDELRKIDVEFKHKQYGNAFMKFKSEEDFLAFKLKWL